MKSITEPQDLAKAGQQPKGFFQELSQLSKNSMRRLKKTIIGDYTYQPRNSFKIEYKEKIFTYLKTKYVTALAQLEQQTPKKFTSYDAHFADATTFKSLRQMKQSILKIKTEIDAASDSLKQSHLHVQKLKLDYYNQVAFEFDRQRRTSICWGLLFGSIICSTIWRRGNPTRKAAFFLLCGHVFGQVSYYISLDKYFDTIYPIFEQDAIEFVQQQQKQRQKEAKKAHGRSIVTD